jgi:adenosylhomocysteine nucleosidase
LAAEARIARSLGEVEAGGGLPAGAEAAAESLAARNVTGLISFGLAGGLDPALRPGHVVIPEAVLEDEALYPTDAGLALRFGGVNAKLMLAGQAVIAEAMTKGRLFAATGASAIDLESGAVARVARRHNLPFAVLRAICDPAERDLPPAALIALDAGGSIGLLRVLTSVLRRPGQIPALIRLGQDAKRARRALIKLSRCSPAETAPLSAAPRTPPPPR